MAPSNWGKSTMAGNFETEYSNKLNAARLIEIIGKL